MPQNEAAQKIFFEQLVAIKDSINQQIPLAANRFEEFECPPDTEIERDVHIQFHVHELVYGLMRLQYLAINKLKETYITFINDNELSMSSPLSPHDLNRIEQLLYLRTNAIYAELELLWQLSPSKGISFEEAKPKVLDVIQRLLPDIGEKGPDTVTVDEEQFIDVFLSGIQEKIKDIMDKVLQEGVLGDEDMELINTYRRENIPHEEDINEFVTTLYFNKRFPERKKAIDEKIITLFLDDVQYNIQALGEKIRARKFSYQERYQATAKLIKLREAHRLNMHATSIDNFLKSFDLLADKETRQKSLQKLEKIRILQHGLYFENQKWDTGFCGEHATLALVKLLRLTGWGPHRIEKVSISYSDGDGHTFIVVDRAKVSDLNSMTTWGEQAILLDPWHHLVCYAKDIDKQGVQYHSFPESADWSSIDFKDKDKKLLSQLVEMDKCYVLTDNIDPDVRESRIIEEYELHLIEQDSMLWSYLQDIIAHYKPRDFNYTIKFYKFALGNDLVKFIPGFREPVVSIHQEAIAMLANKQLSLTSFEFAMANIILQLQMYTNFISPTSISPSALQQIDIDAMAKIASTEACIDYLRAAAKFKREQNRACKSVTSYESNFGGFNAHRVTGFTYGERIKVLQASIASGFVNSCSKELEYPSPLFQRMLLNTSPLKEDSTFFLKITTPAVKSVVQVSKAKIVESDAQASDAKVIESSVQVDSDVQPGEKEIVESDAQAWDAKVIESSVQADSDVQPDEKEIGESDLQPDDAQTVAVKDEANASEETIIENDNSIEQTRLTTLQQLIVKLPELKIELLPYEWYNAPSIRVREFCDIIRALQIDFENPQETALVDELINKAQDLKIPCFEYLYFTIAGRFGVSTMCNSICYPDKCPQRYDENRYYLFRDDGTWKLFYADMEKTRHDINTAEVAGLEDFLKGLPLEVNIKNYDQQISYLLYRFEGLRPLGFFKSIQQAITDFTNAQSFEEALSRANVLEALKKEFQEHFYEKRRELSKIKEQKSSASERFFGTSLGKRIKWTGFDFSSNNEPYIPFFAWCTEDVSGVIASTLFRLGLGNSAVVVTALTDEQVTYFSELYDYQSCVSWGVIPVTNDFLRFVEFNELALWVKECQSKAHQLNDKMFSDASLAFEGAFIQFFDKNLPALLRPDLGFNKNNAVQDKLLQVFYRIACEGTDAEKAVVKSFFYGREDKRDLRYLVTDKYPSRLPFSSNYSRFVCMQTLNDQHHHLFDDYDLKELYTQWHIYLERSEKHSLSLEDYRVIFRIPETDSKEDVLNALLEKDRNLKLSLYGSIIESYLPQVSRLEIFSPTVNKILATKALYFSEPIKKSLNVAIWPNLKESTFQHISIEALIRQYELLDMFTVFPSREIKLQMGDLILRRIMALPEMDEQIRCYVLWLTKANDFIAITDIPLKNKIINNLVANYTVLHGKDDGSAAYYTKIAAIMEELIKKISSRDAKLLMSQWLTAIEAQKKLSDRIGITIDPADYKLVSSKRYKATRESLITLIKVAEIFSEKDAHKTAFLDFIASSLSQSSTERMLQYVKENIEVKKFSETLGWSDYDYDGERKDDEEKTDEKLSTMLLSLYYQFWDCSIYERSAIIEQVLIPASQSVSIELQTAAYDKGMTYISQKLFPKADDPASDDHLALAIMTSYLQTAEVYARSYLLTAMLVSANECMGQEMTISKKLASVCEHMGPAYVKLIQAIHSHPTTTDAIRADLAHVKGRANPPARWSLWRHLCEVLLPEDLARIKRVGRLLGSASYNLALEVTLDDGSTAVLLLLREDAEKSAKKGFTHIRATIDHCEHESIVSQRDMLGQTIDEAARLSKNEMNKEASDEQSRIAQTLYPHNMQFYMDGNLIQVSIKTASIIKSGIGYRFIDLMPGEEFNELPDTTKQEKRIKRAVAKAVLTMELHNIFRGRQFDSDRHGNQLRVLVKYNGDGELDLQIGLYDFGEMALESPTEEELQQLAEIMTRAPIDLYYEKSMDKMIAARIELAVERGESTHYLMRLRKAFLAMHDLNRYLDKQDLSEIFREVAAKDDIHPLFKGPLWRAATVQSGISCYQRSVKYLRDMSLFSRLRVTEFCTIPTSRDLFAGSRDLAPAHEARDIGSRF